VRAHECTRARAHACVRVSVRPGKDRGVRAGISRVDVHE
jgi:hypothetical protein